MDGKKEILKQLSETGEIHRYKKSPLWADAFTAYQLSTKDTVSFNCAKCYQRVIKWLKKI